MNNLEDTGSSSEKLISNVDEFCKSSLGAVMKIVQSSHSLPKAGDDHEFYSSFSGFQEFVSYQKKRLIGFISILMKNNGFLNNFSEIAASALDDVDEYTDKLIECNDALLERVAALLDGCEKNPDNLAAIDDTDKESSTATPSKSDVIVSSWNRKQSSGSNRTFRLLHANNILRPQLKFKDIVDNLNTPFIPKIKVKPHALRPLPDSLIEINSPNIDKGSIAPALSNLIKSVRRSGEEDQSAYEHPYEYELKMWNPSAKQLEKVEPEKFSPLDQDSCIFIETNEQLNELLSVLRKESEFAVDLECHSYRSFQGITCLMQLSTRSQDYIVDTLALRPDLWILNEVFADPNIIKVLHGANFDIGWLQRDFGIYVVNMFDTGVASRLLELQRASLQYLAQHYCDVVFDKKYQLADWRIRPLPSEMSLYAQSDTHYLLYIYDVMRNELLQRANGESRLLRVAWERSRDVCLIRYEKPLMKSDSHLQMLERLQRRQGIKNYSPQQLEALRLIYNWRDELARKEDESPGYILPNHMLIQIAEILPKEAQGILACCNPIPPLLRQHVLAVHQMVKDARLSTPSTFKEPDTHSKVPVPAKTDHDTTNLLTCPHDLSHSQKTKLNRESSKNCQVIFRNTSSLFGPFRGDPVNKKISLSKTNGTRCAFTRDNSKQEISEEKMKAISKSSWDPFLLFFPSENDVRKRPAPSDVDPNQPLNLRYMLSGNFPWKMRKLQSDDDQEEVEEEEKPKTFGQVMDVPDEAKRSTGEQVQIIRQIMDPKRKKVKASKPAEEPLIHVDGISQDLQFASELDGVLSTFKKSAFTYKGEKSKGTKPNFAKKSNFVKKFPKGDFQQSKRPFQPHHYSNDDYMQFKRQKPQKKRRFK